MQYVLMDVMTSLFALPQLATLLLNLCQKADLGRCNSLSDLVHLLVTGAFLAAEDAATQQIM